jgi:hypothetical protein
MAVLCKPFTTADVEYFDEDKADQASKWIQEGLARAERGHDASNAAGTATGMSRS